MRIETHRLRRIVVALWLCRAVPAVEALSTARNAHTFIVIYSTTNS
jgi:hypothetical protein